MDRVSTNCGLKEKIMNSWKLFLEKAIFVRKQQFQKTFKVV